MPQTNGESTQVVPFTIGEHTLVPPQTLVADNKGVDTQLELVTIAVLTLVVPQTNGDATLVVIVTAPGKPIVTV